MIDDRSPGAASRFQRVSIQSVSTQPQYVGLALATLSGCMWFMACAPIDLWLLAWVAMIPLLFAIERAANVKQSLTFSLWAGMLTNGGGFYWLIELLRRFAGLSLALSVLIFILFCAYQALVFVGFGFVVRAVRSRRSLPITVIAPLAIVTFELLIPLLFPYFLSITQAWHPAVIQIVDLTGPMGVTALLILANAAVYDLVIRRRAAMRSTLVAGLLIGAALIYGQVRMRQVDLLSAAARTLKVGIVQPNVAYNSKGVSHPELAKSQLADLQQQSRQLEAQGAELIVWSESSYPYYILRDLPTDYGSQSFARIRRGFTTPLVFGALTYSLKEDYAHNSALLIDRGGAVAGLYDKVLLLTFGERMPGMSNFPWLRRILPAGTGNFAAGNSAQTLPLTTSDGRSWKLGTVICYEDILPGYLRRVAALHPDLLVNLTNDTWFGERAEPWQHLALAVFGAVEQRTSMVRSVNSGVSAIIDANGRVLTKTYAVDPYVHPHVADSTIGVVALLEGGHTIYRIGGDLFAYLCAASTFALCLGACIRKAPPN